MRYLDGELPASRRAVVESHLEACTECRREIALFEDLSGGLRQQVDARVPRVSVWDDVNRRIARPVGWLLFLAGLVIWTAWALYSWAIAPEALWVKLAEGAVFIGFALLLGSVLREHYVAWRTDPYRHIHR